MVHTLHMGPVRLGWRIDDADDRWAPFLSAYAPWLDASPPDLVVEAAVGAPAPAPPGSLLPDSLIRARAVRGRDFDLGEGLVRGAVADGAVRCAIDPVLLHGVGLRVFEQFLYLLFHEAALGGAGDEPSAPFLMHGSAVLDGGGVHVFCGPSESGKSTAAANSLPRRVLTDECVAISEVAGALRADGTPVNPFCDWKRPGGGPLAGVHLIEQAPARARLPIARAEAVPRLTAEIMVPLGLLETDLATGMARAIDRALRLCAAGVVDRLRLLPDGGFWALLAPGAD